MARVIIASSAGTAFEWYDFFIFGSLAPVISKVFFAGLDPTPALIAALALFAAGFAFRPLGALIFGVIGDRLGRKGAFLVTVSLMGGATFLIGFLPTYAQAGTLGPTLLIILRILQGIALGGEYGGAAIYVAEHAPQPQARRLDRLDPVLGLVRPARRPAGDRRDPHLDRRGRIRAPGAGAFRSSSPPCCSPSRCGCAPSSPKAPSSPGCARRATSTKAPLREAFGKWKNLKRVLIAFFGIMCAQGAVWYFTFFYLQVFLEKSLGLPSQTKDLLLIVMTVVSAPLYVYFGWLSDRIGRKPVMVGGMLLALVLYFPASHWIADAANPQLVEAQQRTPMFVDTNPATCSVQFDPVGTAKFVSACDIAKSTLVTKGISLRDPRARTTAAPTSSSAPSAVPIAGGEGLERRRTSRRSRRRPRTSIGAELQEAGYPKSADPKRANITLLIIILLALRRRRDRALRPAGGGAGRDVPDPHPLHRHVVPLPCRHRLGRRLPPGDQLRARRDHRQHLQRAVVLGGVHRDLGGRLAAVPQGNRRDVTCEEV